MEANETNVDVDTNADLEKQGPENHEQYLYAHFSAHTHAHAHALCDTKQILGFGRVQ